MMHKLKPYYEGFSESASGDNAFFTINAIQKVIKGNASAFEADYVNSRLEKIIDFPKEELNSIPTSYKIILLNKLTSYLKKEEAFYKRKARKYQKEEKQYQSGSKTLKEGKKLKVEYTGDVRDDNENAKTLGAIISQLSLTGKIKPNSNIILDIDYSTKQDNSSGRYTFTTVYASGNITIDGVRTSYSMIPVSNHGYDHFPES